MIQRNVGKCYANDCDKENNANRLAIRNNASNLGMEEGTSVVDVLTAVQIIISQLSEISAKPSETLIVKQILKFLPTRFDGFVRGI